jgi:hypothetical protein
MTNENKIDCIESVIHVLKRTGAWRRAISVDFNDPRNVRAATTLEKLAIEAAAMTDEQFTDLEPYFGWSSPVWRTAVNNVARQIAFHNRSKDFASFVKALVHELSLSSRVAA